MAQWFRAHVVQVVGGSNPLPDQTQPPVPACTYPFANRRAFGPGGAVAVELGEDRHVDRERLLEPTELGGGANWYTSPVWIFYDEGIMSKLVEVEITGGLTHEDVKRLTATIAPFETVNRYLINFTTPELAKGDVDLRARITNGVPELVVKRGDWAGGKRREFITRCAPGEFESLVASIVGLGYTRGVGANRNIRRYLLDTVEFSVISVPDYSMFYEAERVVDEPLADATRAELVSWAESKNLHVFSRDEFHSFIDDLDQNANDILDLSNDAHWELVRKRIIGAGGGE